jgi:hypothetical protein
LMLNNAEAEPDLNIRPECSINRSPCFVNLPVWMPEVLGGCLLGGGFTDVAEELFHSEVRIM